MGTKNSPGKFDCYASAAPDEPMFVLLARSPLSPDLVEEWADRRLEAGGANPEKIAEARACAAAMRAWFDKRRERINVDTKRLACEFAVSEDTVHTVMQILDGDTARSRNALLFASEFSVSPMAAFILSVR